MTGGTAAILAVVTAAGCATTSARARRGELSATEHAAMAVGEDQEAGAHLRRYVPSARSTLPGCGFAGDPTEVCWTSTVNPTIEHLEAAKEHTRRAAEHRAASRELRLAEARACAGVAPADRDTSPFAHREDILSVESFLAPSPGSNGIEYPRIAGAIVRFRAVSGMTLESLQRLIDCHLARSEAAGYLMPELSYCPLAVAHVAAKVKATIDGFAVTIASDERTSIDEVLRRARALEQGRHDDEPPCARCGTP